MGCRGIRRDTHPAGRWEIVEQQERIELGGIAKPKAGEGAHRRLDSGFDETMRLTGRVDMVELPGQDRLVPDGRARRHIAVTNVTRLLMGGKRGSQSAILLYSLPA